jgi:4'-phosphopantetheinyl transferase
VIRRRVKERDGINCVQVIDGVHIWRAALDDPGWAEAAELPAEERERAADFLREEAARRWVASRWALRRVLGEYLEVAPAAVELEVGRNGKPRLAGSDGLEFNLSHSAGLALVAVTHGRPVGVDVELIEERRPLSFYEDWVRREARLKCLGVGLGTPPPPAEVAVAALVVCPGYAAAVAVAGGEVGPVDCRSLFAG